MTDADTIIQKAHRRAVRLDSDKGLDEIRAIALERDGAHLLATERSKVARDAIRMKAPSAGGTSLSGSWAEPLGTPGLSAFINLLIESSILGRLRRVNRIPSNVPIVAPGTGGSAAWVGIGQPKPVLQSAYSIKQLRQLLLALIFVVSRELFILTGPTADNALRNQLVRTIRTALDLSVLDPAQTGTADLQPASITATAPTFAATGTDTVAALADLVAAVATAEQNGATPGEGIAIIASLANSIAIASALGSGVSTMLGDRISILPSDAAADNVIVTVPSMILVTGGTDIIFSRSGQATLEMLTDPSNDVSTPTATTMVSMFQTNSVALKAELLINWEALTGSVVRISGAQYGGAPLS